MVYNREERIDAVKLLDLQSSIFHANQWRWAAWWRALHVTLNAEAQPLYRQIIAGLQRDLLVLLMAITIPLGILNGAQLGYAALVTHSGSNASFIVHVATFLLTILCAVTLLRRSQVGAAWGSVVGINAVAVLWQVSILHEPGLLLFALLSLAGPALFAPLRVTLASVASLITALGLLMYLLGINDGQDWINVASLFAAIMFVVICIGVVVRRVAAQWAHTTVTAQADAVEHARLHQRIVDLHDQAQRIASLEHDLRQPLRTVQGYLHTLLAEQPTAAELVLPALAAAQRTDRLLTNLLDQARAEAQQTPRTPQPVDLAQVWINLQNVASGLACYHTDPSVPLRWEIDAMPPRMVLDAEQIERAVLNLLDNALAYSPPHGLIAVRARVANGTLQIEVHDDGPGLPADVRSVLTSGTPAACLRLGLQQVQRTVAAHNGHIAVATNAHGTTIRLVLPTQP